MAAKVLWHIEWRLQVLKEVALDPEGSGTGETGWGEANAQILRAAELGNKGTGDGTVVGLFRARTRA